VRSRTSSPSTREQTATAATEGVPDWPFGQMKRGAVSVGSRAMTLLIEASHKNQNSMVYPEALNAPEPCPYPKKFQLQQEVGGRLRKPQSACAPKPAGGHRPLCGNPFDAPTCGGEHLQHALR
jgi:hypothetical protein